MPAGLRAKIPSVQNPRWLTEEYATSFFQSFCIRQARAPYTIPITDRIPMALTITGFLADSGSSGSEKRRKPYAGQHDTPRGGRFGVRVGQPGVEGEHGHLDGEPHEKRPEHPPLHAFRN